MERKQELARKTPCNPSFKTTTLYYFILFLLWACHCSKYWLKPVSETGCPESKQCGWFQCQSQGKIAYLTLKSSDCKQVFLVLSQYLYIFEQDYNEVIKSKENRKKKKRNPSETHHLNIIIPLNFYPFTFGDRIFPILYKRNAKALLKRGAEVSCVCCFYQFVCLLWKIGHHFLFFSF